MANYDARITFTADARPAEREIDRLFNQIARVQRAAFIPTDELIRVGGIQKTIQTINQLENAVVSLRSRVRSISAPGAGELGDSIRVAATAANTFFDALSSGQRALSNTIAGLREQSAAFAALASNISSTDARFTDYIQGAQAAQDKGLRPLFNQFRALQRLYEEGITGRGVEIASGEMGANFFERLSREIPQTEGALKAFAAELQRVRSVVSSESTAALGIEQLILTTERQLLEIEENRLQVRAAITREMSAPIQGALSRMQGAAPNPFGISDEQINESLNQRAEQYQRNLEEIARVTRSLASMEGKKYDPLGISDEQINAGLNERATQLVRQRDELDSLQQILSAMEGKKYDPLNISDEQINAGLNERASAYQRQAAELANLQAALGAMQGRKVDPFGISDEQVNAALNQRAEIIERQVRDTEALQSALGGLESRQISWATALGIEEADVAARRAQELSEQWSKLQAEADGIAAKSSEAAAALKAFKFESLARDANTYTKALLNQQRTLDEYEDAANRATNAIRELGYAGELPALRPAGFTDQDVRIKNLIQDQTRAADIVADYERKAEMLINDLEIDNISRQLNLELESIEATLRARMKADEKWWAQQKAFLDQKTQIEQQQARQAELPLLERATGSKRMANAISEGLIGGAFPLLFGQGLGASVGGLAGGFGGGFLGGGLGFGLSLVGTALGAAFDDAIQGAKDLGAALRSPVENFQLLKERALLSSKAIESQAEALIESGRAAQASKLIQEDFNTRLGSATVESLKGLSSASDELARATSASTAQLQAFIANMIGLGPILRGLAAGARINELQVRAGNTISELRRQGKGAAASQLEEAFGRTRFTEITPEQYALQLSTAIEKAEKQLKPIEIKIDPKDIQKELDASIAKADKARSLIQQGIELERSNVDLRLSIEDTVYGLRKRATDMEREAAEFRRSVEDQVFSKRQELEQKLAENERKRQQNAIDAFDLQLQKASVGLDPVAQGVVDAAREYLKVRAEGEADLQLAEKQLKLELQGIDQEVNRYKLQIEERVSQMAIQREEFSRDVSRARLQIERQIGDYVVKVEEYRLAMAKHRYELEIDLEKKKQIAAQEGLTVEAKGGYTGTSVDGFPITSRPGMRWGRMHEGVDISAPIGTALGYEMGGKVLSAEWIDGYGKTLKVALDNGMIVLSGHLNEIFVKAGQRFEANQRLATVGSTGRSTGPHTHQESWINGKADPYASLPLLQLGKAVSGASSDIYEMPGVGWFSRRTGRMVSGPGKAPASAAIDKVSPSVAGATPTAPGAPTMPELPTAPQLVGINDLMEQYLAIMEKIKAAAEGATAAERQRLAAQSETARFALEQQVLAPILQYKEQNRELEFEIQKRKERNRLALEGVAPEIIEGEMRVLEIRRALNSVLAGLEITTNQAVKAELERLELNPKLVDSAFRLTEATLANLVATTEDTKKQEELRQKLQKILDLRNKLAEKAEGEAGGAVKGARDAAEASILSPREKVEGRIGDLKKELKELLDPANQVIAAADAIGGAFSESFRGVISGSMSAQEALANFFQRTADHFLDMAAQMITKMITLSILNQVVRVLPGGGGGFNFGGPSGGFDLPSFQMPDYMQVGNAFGFANGGMFDGRITPFANGGAFTNSIVKSPTLFKFADGGVMRTGQMGEAGPEAVMPLTRGPGGRLGVDASGAGGGDISVTVNVDAKGTSVEGNQQQGAALGRAISAAVQAEIVKQKRPGGLLT